MKKIFPWLFSLSLVIGLFYPTGDNTAEAAFSYKKGDILITSETSSSGLTGHTAIYIGGGKVLHTSGRTKVEPYPFTMTTAEWTKRHKKKVKVLRYKDSKKAAKAADMAVKYFKGKKIKYGFTPAPTNMNKTYCSQLVWYGYYKAGVTYKTWVYNSKQDKHFWQVPALIKPYDFTDSQDYKKNGFKLVDSKF